MNYVKSKLSSAIALSVGLMVMGCQSTPSNTHATSNNASNDSLVTQSPIFTESHQDIALENSNRRKWDNAVIADLDHDGYLDMLLTDHGFSIKLYWNNQGKYGKGIDMLVGDTHGIAVGDYNKDGISDVIVARGGGSGANARNAKLFHINDKREIIEGEEFIPPFKMMRGRTVKFYDGNNNGELDLLMFGFPGNKDEKEVPSYSYINDGKGQLLVASSLPKTQRDGQKLLVTDFNNDGTADYILYGDGPLTAHQGNGDLTFTDVTKALFKNKIYDVTSIAEIDYDNDGDFDLFFTRGKEYLAGETFYDEKSQSLAFYTKRGKTLNFELKLGDTFSIKNYQSQWPSQDIFIGESAYKYQHPGEHHKGQDVKLINSNALGWPDTQNEKGLYVGYIGNDTWRVTVNAWSPTTGVIQGVTVGATEGASKKYNLTTPEAGITNLLLENTLISANSTSNTSPQFIDVSQSAGLLDAKHSNAVAVADYDNNGYQDLIIVERGNLATANQQTIYLNNGPSVASTSAASTSAASTSAHSNNTFTKVSQNNLVANEVGAIGLGIEALDYNNDGKTDVIYNNERGLWHLGKNIAENELSQDNRANFIRVIVGDSSSNRASALGALVNVNACGLSQTLRVGNTAARYSQSLNNQLNFGLGDCEKIDQIKITWPNGEQLLNKNIHNSIKINSSVNM